jgi:hypothetical protein
MKTFREMISWELEQEKKSAQTLQITTEEAGGKLGSSILRKLRYLSTSAEAPLRSSASHSAFSTPAAFYH